MNNLEEFSHANVNQTNEYTPPVTKKTKGKHEILELIDDLMHPNEAFEMLPPKALAEFSLYLSEPESAENPLIWRTRNSV